MNGAYTTHGEMRNIILGGKPDKRPLRKYKRRWLDAIKMAIK
jgi:hypothetical protein